jgi:hypothetical protein
LPIDGTGLIGASSHAERFAVHSLPLSAWAAAGGHPAILSLVFYLAAHKWEQAQRRERCRASRINSS